MRIETLKNITTKIGSGSTPSGGKDAYKESGISLIRSMNIYDFQFEKKGLAFIDDDQAKKLDGVAVQEGDILFNITGDSINRTCVVPKVILPARVNQHVSIIRCKKEVSPQYVNYYLINMKPYLMQICGVGGTRNALTKVALEKLPIKILTNQFEIAKVLSDLDAKIELNNKINAELEAMAKLIYDYWFVQFDFPVYNEDGTLSSAEGYKSSGGKMVYNEELKREIPEGWKVGTLLDIATFVNGLACQKFRPENGENSYRVIKIREMGTGFTDNSEFVSQNIPDRIIVKNGDVLFSWSATLDVQIWTGGLGALNQHIFKVTSSKHPRSYYYFELLNYLQHFKMIAELRKTTMGHITQDHLQQSRITIPPTSLIDQIHSKINPVFEKIIKNKEENQKLAELRDWLLPMLMNGQVKVDNLGNLESPVNLAAEEREKYR